MIFKRAQNMADRLMDQEKARRQRARVLVAYKKLSESMEGKVLIEELEGRQEALARDYDGSKSYEATCRVQGARAEVSALLKTLRTAGDLLASLEQEERWWQKKLNRVKQLLKLTKAS